MTGMCISCEGGSRDDLLFSIHRRIGRFGVALQRVDVEPPGLSWSYTIGLADGFDHTELVILGGSAEQNHWALNTAADLVAHSGVLEGGTTVVLDALVVGVGEVHNHHVDNGLVATWLEYYSALGGPTRTLEVLQLVLPAERSCQQHQQAVPLLSDPLASREAGVAVGPNNVDRAERRRRERAEIKRRAIDQRHSN